MGDIASIDFSINETSPGRYEVEIIIGLPSRLHVIAIAQNMPLEHARVVRDVFAEQTDMASIKAYDRIKQTVGNDDSD